MWYGHLLCKVNAEYRDRRQNVLDRPRSVRRRDPFEFERILIQMGKDDRLTRYRRRSAYGYAVGLGLLVVGAITQMVELSLSIITTLGGPL
jgi:hypothetical protein